MIVVETIEPLEISGPPEFARCRQMSPFVWRGRCDEGYMLLARSVPIRNEETGLIWVGRGGADGLRFEIEQWPLIAPEPGGLDAGGCEDPTVLPARDGCIVYYTGVDRQGHARLLYAEGPDIYNVRKRGIAHATSATERGTKEATVECLADDDWRLFFEYYRDGQSRVGIATSSDPRGPWRDRDDPFVARPGRWDSWHLSTGPLLRHNGPEGRRLMFYNGATRTPKWAIGWVVIDDDTMLELARSEEPLIAFGKPGEERGDFAFASSLIPFANRVWLYFTRGDRTMLRATLRFDADASALFRLPSPGDKK
jgi:predicted GH43/DUF377 family glycosyl hydrolase